jgi:sec-independent protein translocase protein TatB
MLDMGFSEILLFGIVAIVVLGPDKLPQAMRGTVGRWYGKARRLMHSVQHDIEKELNLLEMKEQVQRELDQIRAVERDMQQQLVEMRKSAEDIASTKAQQGQSNPAAQQPAQSIGE